MSAVEILRRLRRFLLILALLLLGGTVVELVLVNHTEDAVQWIPFVLCGLGGLAILTFLVRNSRLPLRFFRACMLILIVGSLFGIYQHVSNNMAMEREIHPNATTSDILKKGFGGANPLLAPGILAVAGLLSLMATYKYEIVEIEERV